MLVWPNARNRKEEAARTRRPLTNVLAVALISGAVAATGLAAFTGTDVFLPSVRERPGVPPAVWYTSVWVHNPSETAAIVTFHLLERQENLTPKTYVDNGNVVTDANRFAEVTLPEWFEALDRDFRYQLTVIGDGEEWFHARIARKIEGNSFTIQTSAPLAEVSWQVTGILQDRFANTYRVQVEEDKPAEKRGTYLHPDAWGQPAERGQDHELLSGRPVALESKVQR
ncbi:MAG TPA: hypothetical protein P5234_04250 [Thermoanaerobaculaceae bacterium]|nr:hypothetical protein [Thermoanaerobaculaceae bacterium]HRS15444.1 hypothetical protein [Thermoanaerobaculaceae bacterium]